MMPPTESSLHLKIEFSQASDPGRDPNKQVNEDACGYAETQFGHLCVLCDGMGGHYGGSEASRTAITTIFEVIEQTPATVDPRAVLRAAIEEAGRRVYRLGGPAENRVRPGSTVVAMILHDRGVDIAHVGDSRAYVIRANQIYPLTRDHSMVQGMLDAGMITEAQAIGHPDANKITRALGMRPEVEVEVRPEPMELYPGDVLILASDGLTDLVLNPDILGCTRQALASGSVDHACRMLVQLANHRGGHDNITVQMARVLEAGNRSLTIAQGPPGVAGGAGSGDTPRALGPHDTLAMTRPDEAAMSRRNPAMAPHASGHGPPAAAAPAAAAPAAAAPAAAAPAAAAPAAAAPAAAAPAAAASAVVAPWEPVSPTATDAPAGVRPTATDASAGADPAVAAAGPEVGDGTPALRPTAADGPPALRPTAAHDMVGLAPTAADNAPGMELTAADSAPLLAPTAADNAPLLAPTAPDNAPGLRPTATDAAPAPPPTVPGSPAPVPHVHAPNAPAVVSPIPLSVPSALAPPSISHGAMPPPGAHGAQPPPDARGTLPSPGAPPPPGAHGALPPTGAPAALPHPGAAPGALPHPGAAPAALPHPGAAPAALPHPGTAPAALPHPAVQDAAAAAAPFPGLRAAAPGGPPAGAPHPHLLAPAPPLPQGYAAAAPRIAPAHDPAPSFSGPVSTSAPLSVPTTVRTPRGITVIVIAGISATVALLLAILLWNVIAG
ncbi:phosphoprotein phosphatase [Sorangium cellulosum]|uniref:Phosphoprotein phosphatase n=1 Tax=Sorangium cellulosum TaxID=56 RepID=A0A4P2PYS7_SORCE|nr:protein phosphatase 2C domain-containing protein [Sorangium cellulosum]AUX21746.1 phosphoprotein phosphatase [Sorangium cellulosum]